MRRHAFTLLELIFVIVVMSILAKFGVEFLAQAYNSFIFSKINNELQSKSESAVNIIATRLQYRIKDSVIGRKPNTNIFKAPASINTNADQYSILEWVGSDMEGFRGSTRPLWSGIIDLDPSKALGDKTLISPETNTTAINNLIKILSNNNSDINDSALYFIGSNSNVQSGYGWDGNAITEQNRTIHPTRSDSNISYFVAYDQKNGMDNNFSGVDVYEYYKLAWSAYAVGIDDYNTTTHSGTLKLWYDFQPWQGEEYNGTTTKSVVIMNNVSTFRYQAIGSMLKIQVCSKSDVSAMSEGNYSLCKEKTVY